MVHVSLFSVFRDSVYGLGLAGRSQCAYGKNLSLSSLEESASMSPRQYRRFAPYRSDLFVLSVVGTYSLVEYHGSDRLFSYVVQYGIYIFRAFRIDFGKMLFCLQLYCVHIFESFQLIGSLDGFSHLRRGVSSDSLVDLFQRFV